MATLREVPKYKGNFLTLRELHRNGRVYEQVTARDGVTVAVVTHGGKLIFVEERMWHSDKTLIKCVTGHVEDTETPYAAAHRELREELGHGALYLKEIEVAQSNGTVIRNQHFFLATVSEDDIVHVFPHEEIVRTVTMTLPEVRARLLRKFFPTGETRMALWRILAEPELLQFVPHS